MAPRIIYEGDIGAAHRLLPLAQNQLHRVRALAAASGSQVIGNSIAPNDSSFIYALKVGTTEVLHIFVQPDEPQEPLVPPEFTELPDFLNGVTTVGLIMEREVIDPQTHKPKLVNLLMRFKPTPETALKYKWDQFRWRELSRLTVKPWVAFSQGNAPDNLSQYGLVAPSMYSGRMRKLVQIVQGYGRLPAHKIAETGPDRSDLVHHGIRVRFDFRWHRTHNLFLGPDGTQWLVEVGIINGVLAMQLPMYPDSKKIKHSRWPSLVACFDEFGGLPSGLAFPSGATLQRKIAKGEILQLATPQDLADFYALQPYSTAMGWTFNEAGTEAHNTGWRFSGSGVRMGAHYALNIDIGPLLKDRDPGDPIAIGTARLTKISEDYLYDPSVLQPPALKFHEPLIGGLLSVEMHASGARHVPTTELPGMDTTVHVMWIKNALATVRYFWNRVSTQEDPLIEDEAEDCMYVGQWRRSVQFGYIAGSFRFYTTFEDDRTAFYDSEITTVTTGEDLGWNGGPRIADQLDDPFSADIYRVRAFRRRIRTVQKFTQFGWNCIVVPNGVRDAYAYYYTFGNAGSMITDNVDYQYLVDPYLYKTIRTLYLPANCIGKFCIHGTSGGGGCQCCGLKEIRQVAVVFTLDERFATDDMKNSCEWEYANEGPWLNYCDPVIAWSTPPTPYTPYALPGGMQPLTVDARAMLYTDTEFSATKIDGNPDHRFKWRQKSPDENGIVQTMFCTYNCFGDDMIAYGDTINVGFNKRIGWILNPDDQTEQTVNFLGVVWQQVPAQ